MQDIFHTLEIYSPIRDILFSLSAISGKTDIIFAVDTSSRDEILAVMRMFVKEAVKPLPIETGESQIGLVEYNTKSTVVLPFPSSSKPALSLALDGLVSKGGSSDIPMAVDLIMGKVLSPTVTRAGARKILVLLANGESEIKSFELLEQKLNALNSSEIDYVIVDVGREPASGQRLNQTAMKHGKIAVIKNTRDTPEAMPDVLELIGVRKGKCFCFEIRIISVH